MIYAIIIVVALAAAFIIVIRRLPKAFEQVNDSSILNSAARPTERVENQGSRLTRPKLKLPAFRLPAITLPRIKLPLQSARSIPPTSAPESPELATSTARTAQTTNKEDFWEGAAKAPAIAEPAGPPPAVLTAPGRERTRLRNVWQEAEDAFVIKDYRKAERLYLRLATEQPKNAKTYGRLGVIYLEQDNYDDARDALQAAIKIEPNVATRHFNLALAYLNLGSKAKAISSMEESLKYDPSNRKYRKMLDDILAGRV